MDSHRGFIKLLKQRPFFFWSSLRNSWKIARILRQQPEFVEIIVLRTFFFFFFFWSFTCFVWSTREYKLLVPPQNLFLPPPPPSYAILAPGPDAAPSLWRIWLRLHSELSIFQFSESPRSLNASAVESPTSEIFSTCSKIFNSQCSLRGFAKHLPLNWRSLREDYATNPRGLQWDSGECTKTVLQIMSSITEMT